LSTRPQPEATIARRFARTDLALVAAIAAASVGAWWLLWALDHAVLGPGAHHHHGASAPVSGSASATVLAGLLFVGGWIVMTIAMMLPASAPLLAIFRRLIRDRSDRLVLLLLVVGGYLGAWAAFGALAFVATRLLHEVPSEAPAMAAAARWSPALLFLLAGAFQFSALKYRCLDLCRSPLSFVMSHWHGVDAKKESLRLGWDHGVFCVGCCWALMLLMFAFSAAHLVWMLVLGAIMAVEKNAPWGRRMGAPTGVVLIAVGIALALRA